VDIYFRYTNKLNTVPINIHMPTPVLLQLLINVFWKLKYCEKQNAKITDIFEKLRHL
jgi:hypothetical protein